MKNLKFKTNGVPDDKYFIFDGEIEIESPCCKYKMKHNFSDDHIEYIDDYVGKKNYNIYLFCEKCKKEFIIPVKIKSASYEVEIEFNESDLKKA